MKQYLSGLLQDIEETPGVIIICCLTLLALVSRGYGIWEWSIMGDEYFSVAFADERSKSFINPAYYVLVSTSIELFGLTAWSARLPSALLGVLSVPVFHVTCRHVTDRKTALVGSLFIIFSSWHLYFSQLSRFYSGVFLFGVLSYFLYYKALKKDSYVLLAGAFLSNVLGILFHATFIMVPAACAVYSASVLFWMKTKDQFLSDRVAKVHLLVCAIGILASLPFFLEIAVSWSSNGGALGVDPLRTLFDFTEAANIVLITGAVFGCLLMLRRDFPKAIFFAVGIGIPLLGLVVGSVLLPAVRAKYVFYTLPMIITLASFLCAEISLLLPRHRIARYVVAFLIIVSMVPDFISHYTGHMSLNVREPISYIERRYEPGDKIVVFSPAIKFNFKDHFPDEAWHVVGSKSVWRQAARQVNRSSHRAWILVDTYRSPRIREDFEAWLMDNAALVWRKGEKRFDYRVNGYEIWMVSRAAK